MNTQHFRTAKIQIERPEQYIYFPGFRNNNYVELFITEILSNPHQNSFNSSYGLSSRFAVSYGMHAAKVKVNKSNLEPFLPLKYRSLVPSTESVMAGFP